VNSTVKAPLRISRGSTFTVVALALDPVALAFLGLPVAWISFFLTRSRRGWPVVLGWLAAVQVGLHTSLSLLSGRPAGGPALELMPAAHMSMGPTGSAMPIEAVAGATGMTGATGMSGMSGMTGMQLLPGPGMITAHLIATLITGAALAYGEHLVWQLWSWLGLSITIPVAAVIFPTLGSGPLSWLPTANLIPAVVDRSVQRRGPPSEFRRAVSR
jgi:hypothetical protein